MTVYFWNPLLVDRLRMQTAITSSSHYKLIAGQLEGMKDIEDVLAQDGASLKLYKKNGTTALCFVNSIGRMYAKLEVGVAYGTERFYRVELLPSNAAHLSIAHLQNSASIFYEPHYAWMYEHARVTYLELAVDERLRAKEAIIPHRSGVSAGATWHEGNVPGTEYLGSMKSALRFAVYDKNKQAHDTGFSKVLPLKRTRVEARLSRLGCSCAELATELANPFLSLEIASVSLARTQSNVASWHAFLDACLDVGSVPAFQGLNKATAKQFRAMLRHSAAAWWQPGKLWKGLPTSLQSIAPG